MFLPVMGNSIKYRVALRPELRCGFYIPGFLAIISLMPSSSFDRANSRFLSINLEHYAVIVKGMKIFAAAFLESSSSLYAINPAPAPRPNKYLK